MDNQGCEIINNNEQLFAIKQENLLKKLDLYKDTLNNTYEKNYNKLEEFIKKLVEKKLIYFDIILYGKYLYLVFSKETSKATISKASIDIFHIANKLDIDLIIKNCLICDKNYKNCENENCMKIAIYK